MNKTQYITYKLKREYLRIIEQSKGWWMRLYEPVLRYKLSKYWNQYVNIIEGDIDTNNKKIALLLIYQPKNLAQSVLLTCRHLIEQGYSPLIVANAGLTLSSLESLKKVSWRILSRPNFGYDFGGYKDGVTFLSTQKLDIKSLIIMNDSIWFPLYSDDMSIKTMESMEVDFTGLLEHQRKSKGSFFSSSDKSPSFMGSYFLMFSAQAIKSRVFNEFWLNYKPTSSKYYTVKNGERRLTPYLKGGGLSSQPLLNDGVALEWLKTADNTNLNRHMQEITSHSPEYDLHLKKTIENYADTTEWRKSALDIVGKITNRKNILATAPTLAILEFKVGFFKKGSDAGGIHAINFLIERIDKNYAIKKPCPAIWDEMLARSKKQG